MNEKLILVDVREGNRHRGTQINVYDETHELLKDPYNRFLGIPSMTGDKVMYCCSPGGLVNWKRGTLFREVAT